MRLHQYERKHTDQRCKLNQTEKQHIIKSFNLPPNAATQTKKDNHG